MSPNMLRGHDHLELPRVAHHLQRQVVDVEVAGLDAPDTPAATALKTRCQRSWAWMSTFDLSAITTFVRPVALANSKRVADDPLHALAAC